MKRRLLTYLKSERRAAGIWVIVGLVSLSVSTWASLRFAGPFWQGIGIGGGLLALLHLWSGTRLLLQTRRLIRQLPPLLHRDPKQFRQSEEERCTRLDQFYSRQRSMILFLIIMGILMALFGGVLTRQPFTAGSGFAICIQSAILLLFNLTSHWRNSMHYHEITRKNP